MKKANIAPLNESEAEVFAEEKFRVDVQFAIQRAMRDAGVNQKELAKKLNVNESRVSQILSDRCNIGIRQLARLFFALGDECYISSRRLDDMRKDDQFVPSYGPAERQSETRRVSAKSPTDDNDTPQPRYKTGS